MDFLIEPMSDNPDAGEGFAVEPVMLTVILAITVYILTTNSDRVTTGGQIQRRNADESNYLINVVHNGFKTILQQFKVPSVVGSLLILSWIASFLYFLLFPRLIYGSGIMPNEVCVRLSTLGISIPVSLRMLLLHLLYPSDKSLFYWLIMCPAVGYLLCAIMEQSIGPLMLLISVSVCSILGSVGVTYLSEFMVGPYCYFGADVLFLSLAVIIFLINPDFRNSVVTSSTYVETVEARWIAAVVGFVVFALQSTVMAPTYLIVGLVTGFCISLIFHIRKLDLYELTDQPLFAKRLWYVLVLLVSISLPFSIYRIPSINEIFVFIIQLSALNPIAWKTILGFRGYDLIRVGISPSLWEIVNNSAPLPRLVTRLIVWWLPCSLFSQQRGLTHILAFMVFGMIAYAMASPWWHYPSFTFFTILYALIGLLRAR